MSILERIKAELDEILKFDKAAGISKSVFTSGQLCRACRKRDLENTAEGLHNEDTYSREWRRLRAAWKLMDNPPFIVEEKVRESRTKLFTITRGKNDNEKQTKSKSK